MMKTIDDYLNDPELANEPQALREVHAARLMIQDETKGMTAAERTAYYHETAIRFFASDISPPSGKTVTDNQH
jgi:hypothetical protein